MGSALNSFYSDLATLDNNPSIDVVTQPLEKQEVMAEPPAKKKKKTKVNIFIFLISNNLMLLFHIFQVKLAQGLAMKKKGVSKLVERWKSVQKDY